MTAFSYGLTNPCSFLSKESEPILHHIWVSSPNTSNNDFLISENGTSWYLKSTGYTSGGSYNFDKCTSINYSTNEIINVDNSSATLVYSITNNSAKYYTPSGTPWGSSPGSIGAKVYDNTRSYWEAVNRTGSSSSGTYYGNALTNSSKYLTSSGSKKNGKFTYKKGSYDIVIAPSGNLFVYPKCSTSYCYYLSAGSNFRTGSYTNKWSDLNTAASNANISTKRILNCCYWPNKGFVFILYNGVAIYDDENNSWSAASVSWGSLSADEQTTTTCNYSDNMTQYDPIRKRMYALHCMNTGYLRVFYSNDGLNWSLLGSQSNSNMPTAGNYTYRKCVAADENYVIVKGSGGYSIYNYNNNSWKLNSGITFNNSVTGFASDAPIYCFYYS